jgi:YgiT-type zinc finger domain-containing protein
MTCPICNHGRTVHGVRTLVFQKDSSTIIVKNVPVEICTHCEEYFLYENVSNRVIDLTRNGKANGTAVKMFHYAETCSKA